MHARVYACVFLDPNIFGFCFLFKSMYSFLAQPNAIAHLDLSNTECSLDMVIFFYIARGGLKYGGPIFRWETMGFRPNKIFSES